MRIRLIVGGILYSICSGMKKISNGLLWCIPRIAHVAAVIEDEALKARRVKA